MATGDGEIIHPYKQDALRAWLINIGKIHDSQQAQSTYLQNAAVRSSWPNLHDNS